MKKIIATTILWLLLRGAGFLMAQNPLYQGIIYVTSTGAGTHFGNSWENATSSIDTAQALAEEHDAVVWVAAGTYYGDTTATSENAFTMRDGVSVYGGFAGNEPANYDLSLRDFEANATILDGMNSRRVLVQSLEFDTETTWDGFTIRNGRTPSAGPQPNNCGGGALIRNGNLRHCHLENNFSYTDGGGIYVISSAEIQDCKVANNYAGIYGGGIYVVINNPVVISNCLVANNTGSYGLCSWYNNSSLHVINTTIVNNERGVYSSNGPSYYENCLIWGNGNSLSGYVNCTYSAVEGGCSGEGNINLSSQNTGEGIHPFFVNPTEGVGISYVGGDWHLLEQSACINAGSLDNSLLTETDLDGNLRVQGGRVDIGCYEHTSDSVPDNIIYVTVTGAGTHSGDSWINATSSIDTAQALAQANNAVVWVAAGTYYGDTTATSENAFTMRNGVSVFGGFAGNEPANYDLSLRNFEVNTSILDGMNARRVLYQPSTFSAQTTWDGFTIQNGQTTGGDNGGGAYLRHNGVLNQCHVTDNIASNGRGGGVYISSANISNCLITNNTSLLYAGVYASASVVTNCNITGNTATRTTPYASSFGGGGVGAFSSTIILSCQINNNHTEYFGGGVYADNSSVIDNCQIKYNTSAKDGGGVYLRNNSTVRNCLISNNTSGDQGGGVYASNTVTITNSTIVRNSSSGSGAGVNASSSTTLTNCIVWGNERNGVSNNLDGSFSCSNSAVEGGCPGTGNIVLNETTPPLFVSPSLTAGADDNTANVNWHLLQGSPCINRGNNDAVTDSLDLDGTARIKRDTVDLGCYESDYYSEPMAEYDNIIYVTVTGAGTRTGESWANAASSIAEAQGLAQTHNAVVWVAAGTYYGDTTATSENAFTMRDGVSVYGGFAGNEPADYDLSLRDFEANATVLDGMNARRVLYQPFEFNSQTVWDGFTIQNGYTSGNGGGAYLQRNGALNLCVVVNNETTNYYSNGGGIYANNANITNCMIANNASLCGGGVYANSSVVSNCTVFGNIASRTTPYASSFGGGGVSANSSTISNCLISGNYSAYFGGGVFLSPSSSVINCQISNNTGAIYGGGVYSEGGTTVRGCLISNNTSGSIGGGICNWGAGTVVNTTIVHNQSSEDGAGVNGGTLTNCIVWGNERNGVSNNLGGSFSCTYSAVEEGCPGTGNMVLNETTPPLFVSPSLTVGADDTTANVDWHLQQGSPCINAGDNSVIMDSLDLDGNPRIFQGRVDMGCYEWQNSPVIPVGDAQPCVEAPTVTDYDEIVYNTVKIGNQCWMKENLRTTHYSDGTEISMGYYSLSESTPYRYCPGNNCDYVPDYGYLYNWSAVIHGMSSSNANPSMHQGVCPEGWHVPSASEWVQLLNYVKSESVYWCGNDSNYIAKALANTLGWNSYSAECAVGNSIGENNQTGFSAMPAGNFYGPYDNFNDVAFFWTSSVYQSPVFYALNSSLSFVDSRSENKAQGFSVRCLRNDTLEAAYSGIIYVTPSGAGTHSGSDWANATSSIDSAQTLAQANNAVVWVAAGTYYGDTTATSENAFTMRDGVSVYGGFVGNEPADYDLSLRDFEANATILDGMNARRVLYQPNYFNTETVWNGLTIQNGWTIGGGGGVYLSKRGRLSQCRVQHNTSNSQVYSGSGGGIWCEYAVVENCDIVENTGIYRGGGIYASHSTISDCRIKGNSSTSYNSGEGGGVYSYYSSINRCQITNNFARGGGGINGQSSMVSNCLISNNTAESYGGGIYSFNVNLINNTIVCNTSGNDGAGVHDYSTTQSLVDSIANCIVWGNKKNGETNNIGGNPICYYSAIEGGGQGDNIIVLDDINSPLFVNPSLVAGSSDSTANVDWRLQQGSPCVNRGNNDAVTDSLDLDGTARVKRDTVDLGCYESDYYSVPMVEYDSIIYVTVTGAGMHTGNSWENAISSIDSAQTLALTYNAVVWVAAGTYYGDTTATSENAFTMVDGVSVYGGFAGNEPADYDLSLRDFEANATVLDGQNARRVLYQPNNFGTQTEWSGFTIRNGYTNGNGGGAYLRNRSALKQCKVTACMAGGGGGVYCTAGTLSECVITGCTAGNGGGVNCTDNTTVSSCTITDNNATGSGGGLYSYNSAIVDCDIINNEASGYAGGVYCYYYTGIFNFSVHPTRMIRCRISGNRSSNSGGGVCMGYGNDEVNSCLVSNNSSNSTGGGIYGNGHLNNTTVVRNSSTGDGAGVNGSTYTTLQNCIVWGNERNGVTNNMNGSSIVCSHTAVEGGYDGIGNIMLDGISQPFFVNPTITAGSDDSTANADWHLLSGSICVNRGDNSSVTDSLDMDGTVRIKRDTVDMGCYESDYYSTPMVEYDSIVYVTVTGAGTQSGNSWENATSSIAYAQALAKTYNAMVWVAAGIYYGDTTDILGNAFTMVDGVNVYGGLAGNEPADYDLSLRDTETNASVLDGQDVRRVLFQPDGFGTRTTMWDGFILRHGRTTGNGGGAYLRSNGVLNQCKVTACMAGGGGGVYCTAGTLSECVITGCTAGNGGGVNCTDNTTVSSCTITDNNATGSGGGLYSYNSTIVDCDIINNEASGYAGGVYCYYFTGISFNVHPTKMIRCRISGNRSSNSGGGVCMGYGNDEVNSCLVSNNSSNSTGGGVYGNGHLNNTTVVRNSSTGDGAGVNGSTSTTLQNCIVWGNERNGAVNNLNGSSVVCSHSAIEGGYEGDSIVALTAINPPLFVRPSLTAGADDSTTNVDWHLQQGSPCINAGDNSIVTDSLDLDGTARIKRDTVDLGCYESDYYSVPVTGFGNIIYVTQTGSGNQSGGSWSNATSSLSDAQALAIANNAVVWVAAGTYYGDTTSSNAFTMRDGVNVYGGFAGNEPADFDLSQRDFETNATILDGRNERRVLNQPYEFNKETEWDGFTIQNGRISGDGAGANLQRNSKLSQCKVQNNYSTNGNGGGIYCSHASVENCEIANNSCRKRGGGAYALSSTISDCRIENNTATNGGGGISADASAVANCRIVGNQSSGDGGGAWSYDTRFTHCDIMGNSSNHSGGGVYSYFSTGIFMSVEPTIVSQCKISNNYAGSGSAGIKTGYYNDQVLNSLVCNNTSGSIGGGITGFGKVVNTTIVRNLSGGNSAGVTGDVNLKNCIVWGNKNSTGAANNIVGKEIVCTYSAVEGGFIGEGNFTLAEENSGADNSPYFVNPTIGTGEAYDNGDWHLLPQSVCLNMGGLDTTILSDIDLDGQPRLQQNRVDMGCYEYQAATDGTLNISVVSGDIMRGGAVGGGYYNPGDTVRLLAIPNLYARFLRWSDNDTTNPRVVIASVDTTFTAFFELDLPELHVTSISHSELIGGDSATITWTVRNDGTVPTPSGAVWYDRVWLSPEPKVDVDIESGSLVLLGTLPNMSALNPGDSYTQTMEVNIPLQISGDHYLFVITDAYDADQIFWEDGVEIPYNPPTYYGALSHNCYGSNCVNDAGNKILEISEYDNNPRYPYYHDNFFYDFSEVHIPQFPDLKVTSVFPITQNFFSGTAVNLTYQVTNDGDYVTWRSDWRDVIFVSNSPEFNSDAEILQIVPHHGLLWPDSSYQVSTDVTVPLDLYGTAYFYVHTDYYDQIYEHINNYNNITRSDSVNVFLTLPADLAPQNITADNVVSTGATFNFSYEIHNQGAGAPNHNTWEDKCYLSTNADFLENTVLIARDQHFNGLAAGESYAVQHSITLPNHLTTGTYYLFVNADAENNVFEYTSEENNLARFAQPISVVQPDLQIVSLNVDDTLHAGAEVACIYQLANAGAGAVINRTMTDYLYLTQAPDGTAAMRIGELSYNLWLNAQDTTLKMKNVQLPDDLQSGVYFLFVKTNEPRTVNGPRSVNESDYNNNMSPIKRVYIHYQPLPDLVVTDIELPDIVTAGDSVAMRIHLHNQGEVPANIGNLSWRLFATKGSHQYDCVVGSGDADTTVLPPGSSVYLWKNVIISPTVFGSPASFTLVVNPNHTLTESIYSNNSHTFSHLVQPYPFDLAADQLSTLNETISGEYIPVTWNVENVGTMPMESQPMYMRQDTTYVHSLGTLQIPWYDRVYLSTDSLFDADDEEIGTYTRNQALNAGDSYTANLSCRIPVAADGDYYVLVVSDATNVTFDYRRANNVCGQPISITQSTLPDLQMDTLSTISTLTTGDSYQVRYTVSNVGEHVTHDDRWTEAIYLNNQPTLVDAVLLGSKTHYGQLEVSEWYTDSLSVTIPNTWIGNCYLIGVTDATDQIVESNDETNNMFTLPVSIARPLPCDLTVIPPDIPESAMVGEDIQISWTLQNIGLNTAQGNIKDAVYLSIDNTWSSDDIMLGSETFAVNLAANGQQQRNATLFLQGVPIGDYYVVVKTNILNALNENSYDNNNSVSLLKIHLDYPSLYIGQEEHSQLNSGQSIYYKLEVGPEYEHQTLSCKLTAPSPYVSNDLYIAYSSAPSASNFDWSATRPYVQAQEILIPSLNQGIYYIMAHGQTADDASQSVTLLASIINFEIISVNVNSGANAGSVTTQITGAKFDTIMDFRLANSNAYLPAEKVFFHNSTEAYATFNLRGQEPGVYDMEAELPGGIITVKGQAFVVEPGLPAELQAHIIAPAGVPVGTTFTVTIEYGNNGSTDLDVSGFLVVSTNGFPIAVCSDSLVNNAMELTFETAEANGNPDVIRPGHFATKTIFVKANRVGNIELKLYPIRRQY